MLVQMVLALAKMPKLVYPPVRDSYNDLGNLNYTCMNV